MTYNEDHFLETVFNISEVDENLSWKDIDSQINELNNLLTSGELIGWNLCSNMIEKINSELYYNEIWNKVYNTNITWTLNRLK